MELQMKNGDYVSNCAGGLRKVSGNEALLQRVLLRLTARRGTFPFWEELGSRLWQLGQVPAAKRDSAAKQYVVEALAEETDLEVDSVVLSEEDGKAVLKAELSCGEERLTVTLDVPL